MIINLMLIRFNLEFASANMWKYGKYKIHSILWEDNIK